MTLTESHGRAYLRRLDLGSFLSRLSLREFRAPCSAALRRVFGNRTRILWASLHIIPATPSASANTGFGRVWKTSGDALSSPAVARKDGSV